MILRQSENMHPLSRLQKFRSFLELNKSYLEFIKKEKSYLGFLKKEIETSFNCLLKKRIKMQIFPIESLSNVVISIHHWK